VLQKELDTRDFLLIDLNDTILASIDYLKSSKLTHCLGLSGKLALSVSQSCLLSAMSINIEKQEISTP